jgi:hypothetical protein
MSAFAAVERRRREELLTLRNQDPPQAQTTDAPVVVEPPAEQQEPPPAPLTEPTLLSPPTLDDPALYGLAGRIVRSLAPHSEADPVALLLQFLAALFAQADQPWATRRVTTNRPTAVTILQALQDQPSPTDRRLFLLSEEFASILPLLARETGQLSPLLRCAWDGGDLSVQHGPRLIHATGPHISLVGHVTQGELLRYIGRSETTTASPTAVSGPASTAANHFPTAAFSRRRSCRPWPANCAMPWTGFRPRAASSSTAAQPHKSCGTIVIPV